MAVLRLYVLVRPFLAPLNFCMTIRTRLRVIEYRGRDRPELLQKPRPDHHL